MGALDVLERKSGVIVGDDVMRLFEYAREKKFAIPAIVSLVPFAEALPFGCTTCNRTDEYI